MTRPPGIEGITALVLAGRRRGGDPLAKALGLADKWQVEIAGKQMLARVLAALASCPRIGQILVLSEAEETVLESSQAKDLKQQDRLVVLPPAGSPAGSVLAALERVRPNGPVLLTTADHALLTSEQITDFLEGADTRDADFVAALADVEAIEARFPEVRRTAWRFRDQRVAGCNLFLLRNEKARGLLSLWRSVEADRKRPLRILRRFGLGLLLSYLLGRLTLAKALERLGKLADCRVAAWRHPDPLVGIDVDSLEDLELVEAILDQRPTEAPRA